MKIRLTYIFSAAVLLVTGTAELFAAGTPAGTVIQSRSRVIFTTRGGASVDTAYSAFVSITVAKKAAVNLSPAAGSILTNSDSTTADYAVSVINSGNGVDGMTVSSQSSKGFGVLVYRDSNGDGILQSGERFLGAITEVISIPVDAQIPLIVRVSVPRGETLNGSKDSTKINVRSQFDTTAFNSGLYTTTIRTAGFNSVNPGLSVNTSTPIAGDQLTYTMTLTNNGSVPANNVNLYDILPVGFTIVSGSTTIGTFSGSSNPVVWSIGTLAPSQSVTISFVVQVGNNVSSGTVIPTSVGVTYSVGANNYVIGSNVVAVTVTGVRQFGVELTPHSLSQTKDAADSAWYRFRVRNTGSFKDVIEVSSQSTRSVAWRFYRDGNNNGLWDKLDPQLVNSNDSAGVDVDSVAAGDSVRIFLLASLPLMEADLQNDSLKVTAASAGDHSKSESRTVVTTVRSPVITLAKSMLPAGDQPAGSVITYFITYVNAGSVAVSNFSVVDKAPRESNYIRNSVKVNGVAVSDGNGGVSITSDENNDTVISVSIGTLAAQTAGSVEFKVKIK